MINEILAVNVKHYIEEAGLTEDLSPERSIFQLTVGSKDAKESWHYSLNSEQFLFKRGAYTGEIFIDWEDEYKYKQKSRKQIKMETTPDYELVFKTAEEFKKFCEQAGKYVSSGDPKQRPKLKGKKLSGAKCDTKAFDEAFIQGIGLQFASAPMQDADDELIAARMKLFALAETFNLKAKAGSEKFVHFAATPRRSYYFLVNTPEGKQTGSWLTVQDGLCKVTYNQGTRLPPLCGLEFETTEAAVNGLAAGAGELRSVLENAFTFKGAHTYGSDIDPETVKQEFLDCCMEASYE